MIADLDLVLDEQQEQLAASVREFVERTKPLERSRKLRDAADPLGFSRAEWKRMAELGWTGICIPEEYGGLGLGFAELAVVLEEAGRKLVPEPLISTLLLGVPCLLLGGTARQKEAHLPAVAAGDRVLSVAYEEDGARYDLAKMTTAYQRSAGGYVLSGTKRHVLDAAAADAIIVSARGESGPTLFVVERGARGVHVVPERRIDSRGAATVTLDAVRVAEDAVIGPLGGGVDLLTRVVDRAAVGLSAEMLGAATQAFEDTLSYLKSRRQFGVTIGSFQALQHRAARLFIELSLLRAAVVAAARTVDAAPEMLPRMACLAKARATDVFLQAASEAIQMHGGIGVTDEFHLGFYLKRARAAEMTFGDAAYFRKRWAALGGY